MASQNKSMRCTSKNSEGLGRACPAGRSVTVPSRTCVAGVRILTNGPCSMIGVLAQVMLEIETLTQIQKVVGFPRG